MAHTLDNTTIIVAHNYYQLRGGEDAVFEAETDLLERHGVRVVRYAVHNDSANTMSVLSLAQKTLWNRSACKEIEQLIRHEQSNSRRVILHAHNTLPLISPAIHRTASALHVPTIQTLHNYRLFCANALFYRKGEVCEDCMGKVLPIAGMRHACYRGSRIASAGVVGMNALHHAVQTWQKHISRYVVFTEFGKSKCIDGGLPSDRITVKPHAVEHDPGAEYAKKPIALFVGRLSPEKGIMILLRAWQILHITNALPKYAELHIIGDGPDRAQAERFIGEQQIGSVRLLGQQAQSAVYSAMRSARLLVYPSQLYETFGKSMIESFACATPVVASGIGAMREIVHHGKTGFHAEYTSPQSFAESIARLWHHPQYEDFCKNARSEFETHYTAEQAWKRLAGLYQSVLK
jgi:glycosyltransferase involved in cell wall biosynthesis